MCSSGSCSKCCRRGPAGPAGPRGAAGASGPAGPAGPAGTKFDCIEIKFTGRVHRICDACDGGSTGDYLLDPTNGVLYVWNGSAWEIVDAPSTPWVFKSSHCGCIKLYLIEEQCAEVVDLCSRYVHGDKLFDCECKTLYERVCGPCCWEECCSLLPPIVGVTIDYTAQPTPTMTFNYGTQCPALTVPLTIIPPL